MNTTLLMSLLMKMLVSFPPVTSFQDNTDVYVSTEEGNWEEARSLCKETNGTNDVLSGCQPWNCKPYSLNTTIKAMGIDTIYWLRGYVLRSRIMEYNGCYQNAEYHRTTQQVFNLTFGDNPIIQCSTICNDTRNGDVILFSNTTCYCVNKFFYNDWKERTTFKEISSDRCNFKCPGDEYNRCGSDIDVTVLSGYTFKPLIPDPIFNTVGQFCFYVNGRQQINYTECTRLLKFKCQKIEISGGRTEWDSDCNHLVVNWYDARKTCKQNRFLQIYPDNECKDNNFKQGEETWHNRFVTAKIIWNKDDPPEDSCLALLVTKNGEYKLFSRGCNQNHTTLCRKGFDIPTDSSESKTMHTSIVWYILSPLLFLLIALAMVSSLRRYRRVHRSNTTLHANVTEEEVPYDRVDYSNMDVISPVHALPTEMGTNDQRTFVASSRNDTPYLLSTEEDGYLNPYQPLKDDWLVSNHIYESTRKPSHENSASLIAESENENACHEYESLKNAQPDDHVYA